MSNFVTSILASPRVRALIDKSAWLLIIPAFVALMVIDFAMAKTLVQWSVFSLVLAGIAIVLSRIVFPQVSLTDLVRSAHADGNVGAGIVAGALITFFGLLMLALVIWSKA